MRKERFGLSVLCLIAILFVPYFAEAQPQQQIVRIGFLTPDFEPSELGIAFQKDLRDLGYVEGKNIHIEVRGAAGKLAELDRLAGELVELNVAAIIATDTATALAAKRRTNVIPIVMMGVGDPVESGIVAGLARPGGNVTGLGLPLTEFGVKQLELLKEIAPAVTRMGVLGNPSYPAAIISFKALSAAARSLALQLLSVEAQQSNELETAFSVMIKDGVGALVVLPDPIISSNYGWITMLAARHHLPSISGAREFAEYGGLLAYGPVLTDMSKRAASYVSKILNGARPADLPVEQPTRFQLILNRKTANLLNLAVPTSILVRADEVIEYTR
jgi:putative ABC transport system substrate-binding protein